MDVAKLGLVVETAKSEDRIEALEKKILGLSTSMERSVAKFEASTKRIERAFGKLSGSLDRFSSRIDGNIRSTGAAFDAIGTNAERNARRAESAAARTAQAFYAAAQRMRHFSGAGSGFVFGGPGVPSLIPPIATFNRGGGGFNMGAGGPAMIGGGSGLPARRGSFAATPLLLGGGPRHASDPFRGFRSSFGGGVMDAEIIAGAGGSRGSAFGRASAGLGRAMNADLGRMASNAMNATFAFQNLRNAMVAAFAVAGVVRFGKALVDTRVQIEKIENTLSLISDDVAGDMGFLQSEAERLGISFVDSAQAFSKFAAAAKETFSTNEIREIFTSVSEASRRLGMTGDEVGGIFLAFEQMASKNVVSYEELRRQLGNYLPGALQIAARSMGVTTFQLEKMVRSSELLAEDLLPAMARQLRIEMPAGDSIDSFAASLGRLENAFLGLKVAMSDGAVGSFLQGTIDSLSGLAKIGSASLGGGNTESLQRVSDAYQNAAGKAILEGRDVTGSDITREVGNLRKGTKPERSLMEWFGLFMGGSVAKERNNVTELLPSNSFPVDLISEPTRNPFLMADSSLSPQLREIDRLAAKLNERRFGTVEKEVEQVFKRNPRQQKSFEDLNEFSSKLARSAKIGAVSGLERDRLKVELDFEDTKQKLAELMRSSSTASNIPFALAAADYRNQLRAVDEREAEFLGAKLSELKAIHEEVRISALAPDAQEQARISQSYDALIENVMRLRGALEGTGQAAPDFVDEMLSDIEKARKRDLGALGGGMGQMSLNELLTQRRGSRNDPQEFFKAESELQKRLATPGMLSPAQGLTVGLEDALLQFGTVAERMALVGHRTAQSIGDGFTDAFDQMLFKSESFGDAFESTMAGIGRSVINELIRQTIVAGLTKSVLGAFGGILGGFGGATTASVAHGGGIVNEAGMGSRQVGSAALIGAKRYHDGGVVGGNEQPVITEKGEGIFTKEQMRALGNMNRQREMNVNVAIALSEDELQQLILKNPDTIVAGLAMRRAQVKRIMS